MIEKSFCLVLKKIFMIIFILIKKALILYYQFKTKNMNKFNFKEVKKLELLIHKEIKSFREKGRGSVSNTIIPELFERMYVLDEPTWEKLVLSNKDIAQC